MAAATASDAVASAVVAAVPIVEREEPRDEAFDGWSSRRIAPFEGEETGEATAWTAGGLAVATTTGFVAVATTAATVRPPPFGFTGLEATTGAGKGDMIIGALPPIIRLLPCWPRHAVRRGGEACGAAAAAPPGKPDQLGAGTDAAAAAEVALATTAAVFACKAANPAAAIAPLDGEVATVWKALAAGEAIGSASAVGARTP